MSKKNELIVNSNPKSVFSEAVKTIRTNILFSTMNKDVKVILNTSPEPGDGKSFISANLAVAYQQENKRVLIIDCDLRKGRQHEIFGVSNNSCLGYSNLILNYRADTVIEDYIMPTNIKNLHIIPAGPTPPNPIELLSSKNNYYIMESLKQRYDIIILDCPPILGLSDAVIMTRYSDANIVVISSDKTKIEFLEKTKKVFDGANAKITGVIMNKTDFKANSYSNYYLDSYYGK